MQSNGEDLCEAAFASSLKALHNQCMLSNVLYLVAAIYAFIVLPGWWKLLGLYVLAIAAVSFAHHANLSVLGVSRGVWDQLDVTLAVVLMIAGIVSLVSAMSKEETRAALGGPFGGALIIVAVYSLVLFGMSRIAGLKTRKAGPDPVSGWGGGPILAQSDRGGGAAALSPLACSAQRYQVDYLALHSAWHSVSGIGILFTVVAWSRILPRGFSADVV